MSETIRNDTTQKQRKPLPPSVRARVLERDHFRCRRCGAEATTARLRVDHIVPVAKGGPDDESNLQTLCEDCNCGKGARDPHPLDALGPVHRAASALTGWYVLRPTGAGPCADCNQPEQYYWRGRIIAALNTETFVVQWIDWLWGEETYASAFTLSQVNAEGWRLYPHHDAFTEACRRVLTVHDHEHLMDFSDLRP